jgi:hypothetical protein
MSGSLTIGANDVADNTGDLIVTFVDVTGTQGITTDGTRPALPGAPWGCYLIAPSISPQPGCVVTLTPPATVARWESCSLIWQPPPRAATLWTMGGTFAGTAGIIGNPKYPAATFTLSGTVGGAAGLSSGAMRAVNAMSGTVGAAAGITGRAAIVAGASGTLRATPGIIGVATGSGATIWPMSAQVDAASGISAQASAALTSSGRADATAGIIGVPTVPTKYFLSATAAASAGITGNFRLAHQYFVSGQSNAQAGIIPFGGNAPLRVSNYITNPRPEGASTGTPGVLPAQWDIFSDDLTQTIVGTGTESQIPYIDLRFNNPSSGGGTLGFQMEQFLTAGAGSFWSLGMFIRVVGGSLANVTQFLLLLGSVDGGGNILNLYYGSPFMPTAAGLASQWFHFDGTFINDAGTATISPNLQVNYDAGAIDFTIRVGGMRAERIQTANGPQYIVVPRVGFVPAGGSPTNFVY